MFKRVRVLVLAVALALAIPAQLERPPEIAPARLIPISFIPCPELEAQAPRCTPLGRNWVQAYPRKPEYG